MTKQYKLLLRNIIKIVSISIVVFIVYFLTFCLLREMFINNNNIESFKYNEFGDFIGGVLNPLFALLSTVAIIFLTYIISQSDNKKAEKSIETQKRITLNQMRQGALNNLIEKLNLYVYQVDKLSFHDAPKGKFHQNVLTRLIDEENKEKGREKVIVWLIILNELENFTQQVYMFSDLFEKEEFKTQYNSLIDTSSKLCEEQDSMKFVSNKTISKYITQQREFVTTIGNYIYSEF